METKKNINRALVLCGGGAKGAYAFGCLKAFKERNIHFDAVAGTSVGGLNALLWSTDSLSEGQKLWDELSFSTVYPVKFIDPKWFPKWFPEWFTKYLLQGLASVLVFLNLTINTWKGLDHPARCVTSLLLTFLNSFPFIIFFLIGLTFALAAIGELERSKDIGFSGLGGILFIALILFLPLWALVIIFKGFYEGNATETKHFLSHALIYIYLFISIPFVGFFGIAFWETFGVLVISYPAWVSILFVTFAAIIIIAIDIWLIFKLICLPEWFLDFSERTLNKLGTVLASAPLYETVESILYVKLTSVPTFVVTASVYDVYDPERGDWFVSDSRIGPAGSTLPIYYELHEMKKWVPHYVDISTFSPEQAALYCVASAALPFGIVPSVKINDTDFVDGGVIDNVPIYPFVDILPAEEIYVVLLEYFKTDEEAQIKSKLRVDDWNEIERLQTVVKIPKPQSQKPPKPKNIVVDYKKKEELPNLVFFYPSEKSSKEIGGFIGGTLRFESDYAKRIMKLGEIETRLKLDKLDL